MQLATLLNRADADTLEALIGAPAVRLMRLLGSDDGNASLAAPDALPALAMQLGGERRFSPIRENARCCSTHSVPKRRANSRSRSASL